MQRNAYTWLFPVVWTYQAASSRPRQDLQGVKDQRGGTGPRERNDHVYGLVKLLNIGPSDHRTIRSEAFVNCRLTMEFPV